MAKATYDPLFADEDERENVGKTYRRAKTSERRED